jgi:hypothetical protein
MNLSLPFYFVQLGEQQGCDCNTNSHPAHRLPSLPAAYPDQNYNLIREAQLAALQLPNVSYATAIDLVWKGDC